MSLDFSLIRTQPTVVFDRNITHNLNPMATEAGIYEALWCPNKHGYTKAAQIIPILKEGLEKMKRDPAFFKTFDSENGWGLYIHFVPFVEAVLAACEEYPDADIEVGV
jgi:hypothetical protein